VPRSHQPTTSPRTGQVHRPGRAAVSVAATLGLLGGGALSADALPVAAAVPATVVSETVASDTMTRSVVGGWGQAATGGAYQTSGQAAFGVDGSAAWMRIPGAGLSGAATLSSNAATDVDARVSLTLPTLPTKGNGTYTNLRLRVVGGSAYSAQLRVRPDGVVLLSLLRRAADGVSTVVSPETAVPLKAVPGNWLVLQAQVSGDAPVALRARVWQAGSSVPDWQVAASDSTPTRLTGSGAITLFGYSSSSSADTTIRFDNVVATSTTEPPPPPAPATNDGSSGSAPIGTTSYAIPSGALFVAPSGSDASSGTAGAPLRSVTRAISLASSGQTIVLRGGVYHESVTIPDGKKLTIQPYPLEAVWFDGSRAVTNWAASGTVWRTDGWTAQFDSSPTFTRGAPDGTSANWQWVNPAYPMAAHPDQLWINDTAQRQVSALSKVVPGTFFADYTNKSLYVGTNPVGSTVRASDLQKAITIRGAGSVLRGLGVRNYAPSVPDIGAVSLHRPGMTLENVSIDNSATIGLSVQATDTTVRHLTVTHSGLLGVHANEADRLVLDLSRVDGNNSEHFNTTPVAGGVKVTRSRTVSVLHGRYTKNDGSGLWVDESTYDARIVGNDLQDNTKFGLRAELSARVAVADNLVTNNGDDGVRIANTSGARIWNNTFVGNLRSINMTQDSRLASNPNVPGHDPRQPFPDPTMTWLTGTASVGNNVLALQRAAANALFAVEDYTHLRSASSMGITTNGNVYNRAAVTVPTWVSIWARSGTDPAVYKTSLSFSQATGQERNALAVDGSSAVNSDFSLVSGVTAKTDVTAQALPADVASLAGQPTGAKHLGAWR